MGFLLFSWRFTYCLCRTWCFVFSLTDLVLRGILYTFALWDNGGCRLSFCMNPLQHLQHLLQKMWLWLPHDFPSGCFCSTILIEAHSSTTLCFYWHEVSLTAGGFMTEEPPPHPSRAFFLFYILTSALLRCPRPGSCSDQCRLLFPPKTIPTGKWRH